MADHLARFDRLFSVSDLHMGGADTGAVNFQIFNRGERLGQFFRSVAKDNVVAGVAGRTVLVLNGDIFDSLAEDEVGYVARTEQVAERMITRILDDRAFSRAWNGLAVYLQTPGCHLVLVGGNHDIELGLPAVQRVLTERLAGEDPEARERLQFATRGEGYACRVGDRRVFCTHGNEYDPFNTVDHEKLGQLGRAQNAGRTVDPAAWTPNFGTRLVVDVMNAIKVQYPFVDLLKPTGAALEAVLIALGARSLGNVRRLPGLARSQVRTRLAQGELLTGLGTVQVSGVRSLDPLAATAVGPIDARPSPLVEPDPNDRDRRENELLLAAERQELTATLTPETDGPDPELLSALDVVWSWLPGTSSRKAVQRSLKGWLDESPLPPGADINEPDDLSMAVANQPPEVTFTVTGHTHRARSIHLGGSRFYLNSGSWIRLLRPTVESLDDDHFDDLWAALTDGTMTALDDAEIPAVDPEDPNGPLIRVPLVHDYTTAVRIQTATAAAGVGGGDATGPEDVVAEIVEVVDRARGVALQPVPGSQQVVRGRRP